jgi:hypothetical protein
MKSLVSVSSQNMKTRYSVVRDALKGQRRSISRGRSRNSAGFGTATPVDVIPGNAAPSLEGLPYLKTTFRNGPRFTKTLYTPSTLRATVGSDWLANALR